MKRSRVPALSPAIAFLVMFLFFVGCSDDNHDNPGVRININGVLTSGNRTPRFRRLMGIANVNATTDEIMALMRGDKPLWNVSCWVQAA